ncbi:hypothetical protein VL04_00350 [Chromobacterium violaceum]|uniref:tail fiber assembly protein n=1 Tax=Chromobacterium violaceum TaxID=536 RepID=UPI000654942B|nr:tail assembly chaperone [Chromobacterium violaceum]KMN49463.1 hypothetical protein VK93_10950 [Chromobacterium violaceum]KMN84199.1 hypothetical protein VL02_21330 [Chromobacterium violaceum]KMN92303.1 hypothetical protein VL04_00350 [Chromobacterium violaceum]KMO04246.1 hypothetical protein VL16_08865 [Chromobacterium violaceum]
MQQQKTVYSYHPQTGEYLGLSQADRSPLDTEEVWLIPAFSTEQQPPNTDEHQVAVFCDGDWRLRPDWRTTPLWDKRTAQRVQAEIGDTPDNLQATALPPPPYATWKDGSWVVDGSAQLAAQTAEAQKQMQQKLSAAYANRRPLEDAAELSMANAAEQTRLAGWKRYCVELSRMPLHTSWPRLTDADWPQPPM